MCPTKPDPKKPDKQTEMGRKKRVPFAVYVAKGSVSARLAEGDKGTGFSAEDLNLLKEAMKTLFLNDESTARPIGSMIMQKGVFLHTNQKTAMRRYIRRLIESRLNSLEKMETVSKSKTRNGQRYGMLQDIPRQGQSPTG